MSNINTESLTTDSVREFIFKVDRLQLNEAGILSVEDHAIGTNESAKVSCDADNGTQPNSVALKLDRCQGGDWVVVMVVALRHTKVCEADASCAMMTLALNTVEVLKVNTMRRGINTSVEADTEERNSDGGQHGGGSVEPGPHEHGQKNWVASDDPAAHQ